MFLDQYLRRWAGSEMQKVDEKPQRWLQDTAFYQQPVLEQPHGTADLATAAERSQPWTPLLKAAT